MTLKKDTKRCLSVVVASLIVALNMNIFVEQGGLVPGGFTGLSKLLQRILWTYGHLNVSFTIINVTLNAIPAMIGFKMVGKKFTLFSCLMILLTGIFVDMIPNMTLTHDSLLIAVFGGVVNGFGLSIALNQDTSSGGTDFIAMALSKKLNMATWNFMLCFNAVVILISGYLFGYEAALYSIIYQFCSTQMVNMLHKRYRRKILFIVTEHPDEISHSIHLSTHHGVTRLGSKGTYLGKENALLYSVINIKNVKSVIHDVLEIDSHAFISVVDAQQIGGNYYMDPID